jgi:hypothetical protein
MLKLVYLFVNSIQLYFYDLIINKSIVEGLRFQIPYIVFYASTLAIGLLINNMFIILSYLWNRITRKYLKKGSKTIVIIFCSFVCISNILVIVGLILFFIDISHEHKDST